MTLVAALGAGRVLSPNTGRLKCVAADLAGGNYSGIRELEPNWLLCNGAVISNSGKYANLYAMLGTKFGALGTLPNLLDGRAPIPKGPSWAVGQAGGEISHVLTVAEIPSHNHALTDKGVADDYTNGLGVPKATGYFPPWNPVNYWNAYPNTPGVVASTDNAGGGAGHNNMPPYLVVGCWLVKL